jgi:hypothetical protein
MLAHVSISEEDAWRLRASLTIAETGSSGLGEPIPQTSAVFTARNNTLRVDSEARVGRLSVQFDYDNGVTEIGPSHGVPAFSGTVRVGQASRVIVDRNVSTTGAAVCPIRPRRS